MDINILLYIKIGIRMATTVIPKLQYYINDFEDITNSGFISNLSQETINLISSLAEQVGAPSYIKTPVFPKKEHHRGLGLGIHNDSGNNHSYHSSHGGKKNKNKSMEISNEEWESIRSFQETQKHISEGININIDNIRGYLNRITESTIDDMKRCIINEIHLLIEANTSEEDMLKIGHSIFNIASSNSFYSTLYASLFKDLMKEFTIFRQIFDHNFIEFMNLFKSIDYVDPKKDYDKFCEYTKANDRRRAMSKFIVNLMMNEVINKEDIINIIDQLQSSIKLYIKANDKTNEVEELTENLYIIITETYNELSKEETVDDWNNIVNSIEVISCMKPKAKGFPSISNKTIFKHLDMIEEINK